MVNHLAAVYGIAVLVVSYSLQLLNTSTECSPCYCQQDAVYGGIYADCSNIDRSHMSLPEPANVTTLLCDYNNINTLSTSDFEAFPNLRHFSLKGNRITRIQTAPKVIFKGLEYLDLSRTFVLGLPEALKLFTWFNSTTLKTLLLDYMVTLKMKVTPLDWMHCRVLQYTALKEVHLDGNVFSYVGKNCISVLPKTIEILSVRYTMIGDFDIANFTGILNFKSLRILDVTGFVTWDPGNGHSHPWHTSVIIPVVFIMPSIEVFRCGSIFLKADVGKLTIIPWNNNLTKVDASRNLLTSLNGPVTGVKQVSHVDLSQNTISSISKTFFPSSNKMTVLNISNNFLGQCLEADTSGDILKQGHNLEVLDISNNGITFIPKQFFQWSVNLQHLYISGNFLTTFDVDILQMRNLSELNLKNNKLSQLPHSLTDQLNRLPDVKVIIDDNPLSCSCDTLEFLEWMKHSRQLLGMKTQICTLQNGSIIQLKYIDDILSSLHESCKSDLVLIASSASGAFALLLFVSGVMVYRHRWKLRYLYHVGRNKYQLINNQENDLDGYQYDAFISYADTDRTFVIQKLLVELEDKAGLQTCIHHRDFLPGDVITENIINAIQKSKKTVIILSPAFLKSEWCIYEFHMARLDGITRKLNNILILLLEEVDVKELPKDLALMMTKNSYLEYSTDQYGEAVFWATLTEGIKTMKRLE